MRKVCGNGIDVQYGKHLSRIEFGEDEQGVTARFADGTWASGTLVVGADGARSRVREVAMGSAEKAATRPFPIWHLNLTKDLSHEERLAMIKEKAAGLAEPARSSFMWIPEGTQVHKADISYWITEPWDNYQGRLTLTGDAAHPMPPYRGQGLNHCIADISSLMGQIKQAVQGEGTWKSALSSIRTRKSLSRVGPRR
ncbi:MAG: hypothetical protein L6R38_003263 [Xanthoria sp. 2 TBL-2021]|nr:MAG: hypothetical protein L6R38_003263 [Xanthoria sp. 2 TBL-2021]